MLCARWQLRLAKGYTAVHPVLTAWGHRTSRWFLHQQWWRPGSSWAAFRHGTSWMWSRHTRDTREVVDNMGLSPGTMEMEFHCHMRTRDVGSWLFNQKAQADNDFGLLCYWRHTLLFLIPDWSNTAEIFDAMKSTQRIAQSGLLTAFIPEGTQTCGATPPPRPLLNPTCRWCTNDFLCCFMVVVKKKRVCG